MKKDRNIALIIIAMRLTLVYMVLTSVTVFSSYANEAEAQGVLDKRIRLNDGNTTIKKFIRSIEDDYQIKFIYSSSAIHANRAIHVPALNTGLADALNKVLLPADIQWQVTDNNVLLLSVTQEVTIAGKISDAVTHEPIAGASVVVKGSTKGTTTDDQGRYSLAVKTKDAIVITYLGYVAQEFVVSSGTSIYDIALKPTSNNLDEIVVTGYSSQRVKDLTGAVAVVDVKQLKSQPVASAVEALQGKATGVQVITDGAPGATPQIRIRGFSTINNNDPLYVIDGIPYEGKLSWLNQNDIESLQVLKDASSASIYGSRANNGVVIITTKKGVKGPPKFNFDMYYGSQQPRKGSFPEMMNPTQYAHHLYQSFLNAGITPGTSETTGSNYGNGAEPTLPEYLVAGGATGQNITAADADPAKYNYSRDAQTFYQIVKANQAGTNWFEEMTKNAPSQNYQLSVMGGGDNANYAVSGGYLTQKGIVKYTGYERYNVRSNTTFSAFDNKLRFGENIQYSYEQFYGTGVNPNVSGDYQGEGSPFGFAYRIPTIIPVYDIMGNFAGSRGDKLGNAQNPVAMLYRAKDNVNKRNFFFGNAYAEVDIIEGLTAKTSIGIRYENYNGLSVGYPNLEFSEGSTNNTLSENHGFNTDWTWTNTLNYKININDLHSLTVMAGTEAISSRSRSLDGGRSDFFQLGNMDYYYLSGGSGNISNNSTGSVGSLFSIFGRVDYAFNDRYLIGATVRRDGSSNFSQDHRYGVFPAVSGAWRISEEEFLKGAEWLNDLKFRVGYGVTGNQRIPANQYVNRFSSTLAYSSYPIEGDGIVAGIWQSGYENPSVKWEQVNSLNLGLDFTILGSQLDGSFDWYNRKTTDMLYPVPLPAIAVGMGAAPFVNIGDMRNKGVELALGYHYGQGEARPFTLDLGINISRNINEVLALAPSVTRQIYGNFRSLETTVLQPGSPFGAFFGYQVSGIYQNDADVANSPSYPGARVGGLKYTDVSGPDGIPDGIIDPMDRTVIGSPHPDFLYSLSVNARYKQFDVAMFFNGSQGNDLYEATRYFTDFSTFDGSASTRLLNPWSPDNPGSMIPSPYRGSSDFEYASSSYYVQNGSYFRMKNLQIGYTFPAEKLFHNKVNNLRVYLSATNVFTITNYTGMDPEVSQTNSTFSALGVDFGVYPTGRQYLIGVSLGF